MTLNLTGAAGHVAVVGGPRSGKSTLLRTHRHEHGAGHDAARVAVLRARLRWRHVRAAGPPPARLVVSRPAPSPTSYVASSPRSRASSTGARPTSAQNGIDSIETYRSRRTQGRADDGWGDVFLVIDGWSTLRAEFDDLEMEIQQLAARGLTFGLHIVAASDPVGRLPRRDARRLRLQARAAPRRPARLRDRPQGRRAGARPAGPAADSCRASCTSSARCRASTVTADADTLGDGVDDLIDRMAAAWKGPPGPKLRLLPEMVTLDAVREDAVRRQLPQKQHPARHQREGARTGRPRRRRRAAHADLRRRPVGQERAAARRTSTRSCAPARPRRRRSSSSTTGARCSARCPTSTSSTT